MKINISSFPEKVVVSFVGTSISDYAKLGRLAGALESTEAKVNEYLDDGMLSVEFPVPAPPPRK